MVVNPPGPEATASHPPGPGPAEAALIAAILDEACSHDAATVERATDERATDERATDEAAAGDLSEPVAAPGASAMADENANADDSAAIDAPDVAQVNVLVRAEEPGEGAEDPPANFQTIFRQAVLDDVRDHAESQPDIEVCGVLVGRVYENVSGAFSYVEGNIRGTYAAGRSAQVTFTAETWQHIDRVMDEQFPGLKIIGWYHTHPGFGIFLSEMDLFIQRHFFSAPWQGALVYDPQSKERGLFGWQGGEIVRQNFVIDNGQKGAAVTESAGPNLSPKPFADESEQPSGGPPGTAGELTARIRQLENRQRHMLVGMAALMLVSIVWPLVVLVVMGPTEVAAPPPLAPTPTERRVAPPEPRETTDAAEARMTKSE